MPSYDLHIYKFSGTGNGHGRFQNATGMAVDNKGYLYIGDHTLHCIQKLTLYGQFISQFGCEGTAEGQFKIPTGLLFSQSQLLFVCDSENHRIQVFLNELFSYTFGKFGNLPSYFNSPTDLALNSNKDQLFFYRRMQRRGSSVYSQWTISKNIWRILLVSPSSYKILLEYITHLIIIY